MGIVQASKSSPSFPKNITSMVFITLGKWAKDWAKMEAFLSQLDILHLGEQSFALAKTGVFILNDLPSPWRGLRCSIGLLCLSEFETHACSILLLYNEGSPSQLRTSSLRRRPTFTLANPRLPLCNLQLRSGEALSLPWRAASLL